MKTSLQPKDADLGLRDGRRIQVYVRRELSFVLVLPIHFALLTASSITASAGSVENKAFEVSGRVAEEVIAKDGTVTAALDFSYQVNVDGFKWKIATEDLGVRSGSRSSVQFRQIGCDGRDMFELNEFPESIVLQSTNGSTNRLYGYVREGTFPAGAWPLERILWLAFCSAPYLPKEPQLPSFRDPANPLAQPKDSRSELSATSGLPTYYEQVSKGHLSIVQNGQVQVLNYPAPLDVGFVEFLFEAISLTNAGGVQVPLIFTAQFFMGDSDFQTYARRRLSNRRVGKVEIAFQVSKPLAADQWPPEVKEAANIYDYRFVTNSRPLMYRHQGGSSVWLRREDPHLAATFASKTPLVSGDKLGGGSAKLKIMVRLALLASIASCLVWVWKQQKQQNRR